MAKYTVTLTQAYIRYTRAVVEVEAETDVDAAHLAQIDPAAKWGPVLDVEDAGQLKIEVENETGGVADWTEEPSR